MGAVVVVVVGGGGGGGEVTGVGAGLGGIVTGEVCPPDVGAVDGVTGITVPGDA
jgi:hypothetical protein